MREAPKNPPFTIAYLRIFELVSGVCEVLLRRRIREVRRYSRLHGGRTAPQHAGVPKSVTDVVSVARVLRGCINAPGISQYSPPRVVEP